MGDAQINGGEEGRDGARSGPGRGHGLPMHVQNCVVVPRGIVDGQPAAHSGAAAWAIFNHCQQV